MPGFDPKTRYDIVPKAVRLREFCDYQELYVVRPPYQRKTVWSRKKQQALLDSLFRRYYVPRLVLREVRLSPQTTVWEVIDGQQRITTAQRFLTDKLPLPDSLADLHPDLPDKVFSSLPPELRKFVDQHLQYEADLVKGIDNPRDPDHQKVATGIFWRLQQGESLNLMEVAHSRLSSLARNFVVKYADDQRFDYEAYQPSEGNPDKLRFFSLLKLGNTRMQHLALLARLLMLEEKGCVDVRDQELMRYVEDYQRDDGIGSFALETTPVAKRLLHCLSVFYRAFEDDPVVVGGSGLRELRIQYYVISMVMLLSHLLEHYVVDDAERRLFHDFVIDFHKRWRARRDNDGDVLLFSDNRRQDRSAIEVRDRTLRQSFFQYCQEQGHEMLTKDARRAFSEAERIAVYRRDRGLCQMCLQEGKSEKEARVPWSEYQTDHVIPHSKGGQTHVANAQVLCRYHNQSKGATV